MGRFFWSKYKLLGRHVVICMRLIFNLHLKESKPNNCPSKGEVTAEYYLANGCTLKAFLGTTLLQGIVCG